MSSLRSVITKVVVVVSFLPTQVLAYTNAQNNAVLEDRPLYVKNEQPLCSAASGNGPTSLSGHILPAAKGGTGFEEAIDSTGAVASTGGKVTFAGSLVKAPANQQQAFRDYYITMRWRYVKWNWNGSSTNDGPEDKDFYAKAPRVTVTNPRTNKSIVAVVLEAGPGPWTGVDNGPNNNPKQGWVNPQDGTPATYKGRVSGFPPKAIKALGATMRMQDGSGDDLEYSWADDQNATPGPTTNDSGQEAEDDNGEACPGQATNDVPATGNMFIDSSSYKCPVGKDGGVQDGYHNGKKIPIRICIVHGIDVNVLVAKQVDDMLNANKNLSGGGFRTMAEQIQLRKDNGCPDVYDAPSSACATPTARPGYSNHQMGLAMDLSYNGSLIRSHSNAGFTWLAANASKYGFKNFPKEAWHWSVDGK